MLKQGTDGNTLFNECGEQTLPGSSVSFTIKDTVNADFNYTIGYGCTIDTIAFFHPGNNSVNNWRWELDEGRQSNNQNPLGLYSFFNEKTVQLLVSNGFCTDSSQKKIILENFLKADFSVFEDNCPSELIPFTNASQGRITNYSWAFGDGGTSDSANPHHVYLPPNRQRAYNVILNVTDSFGCQSIAQKTVLIYSSCYLAVPNGFTPNNDGKNDFFYPLNAIKTESLNFLVFNRWGSLVYKTNNWKKGWDGKVNGVAQATGTYVWLLRYIDRDTRKAMQQKGTVTLIR
jgi:gliding motility-associated-like protein